MAVGGFGSMTSWLPEDNNLWAASTNPFYSLAAASTVSSGKVQLARLKWTTARLVGTLYTHVHTAGATLTSGQNLLALFDGAGNLLTGTTSSDRSTAWTSTGVDAVTLGAPVTIPRDPTGYIYGAALVKGTTPPIFRGTNAGTGFANVGLTGALAFGQDASTGNSAMPATVTLGTMGALNPWFFAVGP